MKVQFITPGSIAWASSRMRAHWPAKYMQDTDVIAWPEQIGMGYDAYVFVKVGSPELMQDLRAAGKQVWWDLCDPAWWFNPTDCQEIANQVTGVVCSNQALANDFNLWRGEALARVVPDRLELSHFPLQRQHADVKPVRFVWFGASQNRIALFGGLTNLERLAANGHKISLTILDDHPDSPWYITDTFPVNYERWSLEQENEILVGHDIALLPPYPGPWGQVKSNNKYLTAWACGLPVVDGMDYGEMEWLTGDATWRSNHAAIGRQELEKNFQVKQSAREWETLLCRS
jgi:hypothetical protein